MQLRTVLVTYGNPTNERRRFNLPTGETLIRARLLEILMGAATRDVVFAGKLSGQISGGARSTHNLVEMESPARKPILVEEPLIVPVAEVMAFTTSTTPEDGNAHINETMKPAAAGVPVRSQTRTPFKLTVSGLPKKLADDGAVAAMLATHTNTKKVA